MMTQHSIQSVTPEGGGVWWTTAERCALIRKQLILSETQLTSLIIIVWNSMEGLKATTWGRIQNNSEEEAFEEDARKWGTCRWNGNVVRVWKGVLKETTLYYLSNDCLTYGLWTSPCQLVNSLTHQDDLLLMIRFTTNYWSPCGLILFDDQS